MTLLFESFAGNLVAILPVFIAESVLIVVFAPIIEEFAKAYHLFYRRGETGKSIFILEFLVGLGFGISKFLV